MDLHSWKLFELDLRQDEAEVIRKHTADNPSYRSLVVLIIIIMPTWS